VDFGIRLQILCIGQTSGKKLKYNGVLNQLVMDLKKTLNESRRRFCIYSDSICHTFETGWFICNVFKINL
jgi:uncharacterized protein YccT (UPF0319 family)